MKKLANKTFLTLFIILSLFLFTILFIFNYQNYIREKSNLVNNLNRLSTEIGPKVEQKPDDFEFKNEKTDNHFKRFMDANIYTVRVDNNEISDIFSHAMDDNVSDEIKKVASNILQNKEKKKIFIGNLYSNRYSYQYEKDIVISDNYDINTRLTNSLKLSIIIFFLGELICYVISVFLSKWLVKPAETSYNKQKEFIADASHELKTPLSVIIASTEAYEKDKDDKWLNNIKNESERMNSLIRNLLDLAKLDSDNFKIQYEIIDLSKLCEKLILTLESLMYEKDIKLEYNIDDDIRFNCNSDEIKELITILLDNAIKHSVKDGKIIVNLSKNNDKIYLEIKNKGLPIPKGEEEKIFERFYRVDKSRNTSENRYGLGLAIAKSIVERHNGKISANSTDDYTIFKVIFKK